MTYYEIKKDSKILVDKILRRIDYLLHKYYNIISNDLDLCIYLGMEEALLLKSTMGHTYTETYMDECSESKFKYEFYGHKVVFVNQKNYFSISFLPKNEKKLDKLEAIESL
jgi:hypothetical protein